MSAFCTRWNLSSLLGRFVPVSKGSLRQPDPYLPAPITGDATNMLIGPSDPIESALEKALAGKQGEVLEVLANYVAGFPKPDPGLLGPVLPSTLNRTDLQTFRRWSNMKLY